MKYFCLVVLVISLSMLSCGSDSGHEIDKEPPIINVAGPERNVIYAPGDTVVISALIQDNRDIRNGSVHVHDLFNEADTLFSFYFKANNPQFALDTFWVVNAPADMSYVIYFESTDKAENYTRTLRYFYQFH